MAADEVAEALLAEGRSAFDAGDYRTARSAFSQASLREPRDARMRFWLAAAQYHLGNVGEAAKLLAELDPAGPSPVAERPAALFEYLCRCHLGSDASRALAAGEPGLQRDPDDPRLRLVLGNACFRLERFGQALGHYDAAWSAEGGRAGTPAFPSQPGQVPYARSTALLRLERWDEALAAIDDAIARDPKHAKYHDRRAVILLRGLDDPARAAESAERAVALDPQTGTAGSDGSYYHHLALAREKLGDGAAALRAIDLAIAISPARAYRQLRERLLAAAQGKAAPAVSATAAPAASATAAPAAPSPPARTTFADVGGMHGLKEQVRRIIEVVHTRRDEARRYGIVRNGILLYGPPGCGKTFFAEAIAGEFGLDFVRVSLASALTKYVGGAAESMQQVFADARARVPCLLFFDEFDAIASRRDDAGALHEQQTVNALLQQIDLHRDVPGLVIAAATNRLHEIDPAVIRDGRFDYKVKIYRPDFDARRAILETVLGDRPRDAAIDTTRLAGETEGFSAAQIRHAIDAAALAAMEARTAITQAHLQEALRVRHEGARGGGRKLGWDDLVLPERAKRKLQLIERFIENPALVEELGVDAPTGVLLHGPPGTGKTTIARVLAAQTDAAFYALSAADVLSKWLGESERRMKELFETARENVPAIVFLDEVEAILGRRSASDSSGGRALNAVVNTFLAEMDGIERSTRIFVIAATNRPDLLDEAVLRPGRLSEAIEIGLPDEEGRLALLRLHGARMRLAADVDLAALAADAAGASGADLKGLCTAAGRNALLREIGETDGVRAVVMDDFRRALEELFPQGWPRRSRIGFELAAAGDSPDAAAQARDAVAAPRREAVAPRRGDHAPRSLGGL